VEPIHLTRIPLDPRREPAALALADPYALHMILVRASMGERILFRLERGRRSPWLLVQSPKPLDPEALPEGFGPLEARLLPPFLQRGRVYPFRLRANPTRHRDVEGKRVRVPLFGDEALVWLAQRFQPGLALVRVEAYQEPTLLVRKPGVKPFPLHSVLFTGVAVILDPEAAWGLILKGVGSSGKAFGFGLLSLLPPKTPR